MRHNARAYATNEATDSLSERQRSLNQEQKNGLKRELMVTVREREKMQAMRGQEVSRDQSRIFHPSLMAQ